MLILFRKTVGYQCANCEDPTIHLSIKEVLEHCRLHSSELNIRLRCLKCKRMIASNHIQHLANEMETHIRELHTTKPSQASVNRFEPPQKKVRVMISKNDRDIARAVFLKEQALSKKLTVPKLTIRPITASVAPGYKCQDCRQDFSSPADLQRHYTAEHLYSETKVKKEPSSPAHNPSSSDTSRPGSSLSEGPVARIKRKRLGSWITAETIQAKMKKARTESMELSSEPRPSSSLTTEVS